MGRKTCWWVACVVMACSAAQAQESRTVYLEGGMGQRDAYAAVIGVTLPWQSDAWHVGGGALRGQWDGYVGNWSSRPSDAARRNTLVFGIGPSVRWRASEGRSPWFVEAGTGLQLSNRIYRTGSDRFSTRYNFATHVGVGRNFGAQRQHALSLRVQHTSNAGIKHPNPGENLVLLRYAHMF